EHIVARHKRRVSCKSAGAVHFLPLAFFWGEPGAGDRPFRAGGAPGRGFECQAVFNVRKGEGFGQRNRFFHVSLASHRKWPIEELNSREDHWRSIDRIDHLAWEKREQSVMRGEEHLSAGAFPRAREITRDVI